MKNGWRLWADKVSAATDDLRALGAFRLDFPGARRALLIFFMPKPISTMRAKRGVIYLREHWASLLPITYRHRFRAVTLIPLNYFGMAN
ncbi:hypothetical protein ACT691_10395 [Vibrio metschnikovii]